MASADPISFGSLLRRLRTEQGLTQEQLAAASGLGVSTISDLERGLAERPRASTVAQLSTALQLTADMQAALEAARRRLRRSGAELSWAATSATRLGQTAGLGKPGPPLVGRATELAALDHLLARQGPPLLALLGEPGIGKTRLLQETVERGRQQDWRVLAGGCTRRSGQEPYSPLVEILAGYVRSRSPAQLRADLEGCSWLVRFLPELVERAVAPSPSWTLPPEQERRLMFAAVQRFLTNVSGPQGMLLVLDDLQWASADVLDLIATLVRLADESPVRVAVAARSTDLPPDAPLHGLLADLGRAGLAERLFLRPLALSEVAELVAELLHELTDVSDAVRTQVTQRAAGVPFFAVSLAQAAASQHEPHAEDQAERPLPWTVRESIRQRLASLPPEVASLLGVLAVAGRDVEARLMLAVAEREGHDASRMTAWVAAACGAGLVLETAGGTYRFAHDLIQEVVNTDLPQMQRVLLHRELAEVLERGLPPGWGMGAAELAWHWSEAGEPARALPYALQAGNRATQVYAYAEAQAQYHQSVQLAHGLGDQLHEAEALERLSEVFGLEGRYRESITVMEQAIELWHTLGDFDRLAWDAASLSRSYDLNYDLDAPWNEGLARLQAVLETLAGSDPGGDSQGSSLVHLVDAAAIRLSARSAARICLSLMRYVNSKPGRDEEELALGRRAVEYAERAGEQWLLARAQVQMAIALGVGERLDEAVEALAASVLAAEKMGDLEGFSDASCNLAYIYAWRGQLDEARSCAWRSFQAVEGYAVHESVNSLYCLAIADYLGGEWDQVSQHLDRASTTAHGETTSIWITLQRGMLRVAQGQVQEGKADLEEVMAAGLPFGNVAQGALGEYELLVGQVAEAHGRLSRDLGQTEGAAIERLAVQPLLAWALADLGELARAEALLADALDLAASRQLRVVQVDTLRIEALVALRRHQHAKAAGALAQGLALAQSIPCPYAEAKLRYVAGQVHLAEGSVQQAREELSAALAICDQLGERLYRPYIERMLTRAK
jgi:transcriptional regulator with XRE-family HTH domain/tetratricopeptide (TPR) repeat protein